MLSVECLQDTREVMATVCGRYRLETKSEGAEGFCRSGSVDELTKSGGVVRIITTVVYTTPNIVSLAYI
jgi:hypothetical protein